MHRLWPLLLFVIFFIIIAIRIEQPTTALQTAKATDYQRIVSLAPSITETVFALELGEKLVAVTDYCNYPPKAESLPKIGGYIDTSLEAITKHRPDLVIVLQAQQKLQKQLEQLGIDTLAVDHSRLSAILNSIKQIAEKTGRQQQAQQLLQRVNRQIMELQTKTSQQTAPSVLLVIAHNVHGDHLEQVYIAGQHDFYNDLLRLAGGLNVYQDSLIKVPTLSTEGIIALNPDVIIDIIPRTDDTYGHAAQIRQQWQRLTMLKAVRQNRLYLLEQDYASIPGPRIFNLLPVFAQILHPQLDWSKFVGD